MCKQFCVSGLINMSDIYFYENKNSGYSLASFFREALSDLGELYIQDAGEHCGSRKFLAYVIVFSPEDPDHIGFIYSSDFGSKDSGICSYLKKFYEPDSIPFCPSHSSLADLNYRRQGVVLCPNSFINPCIGEKKPVVFIYTENRNRESLSAAAANALKKAGYKAHVHARFNSPDCKDDYDYMIVAASPENGAIFFYESRPPEDRYPSGVDCPIYELPEKFLMPGGWLDESHTEVDTPGEVVAAPSIKEKLAPGSMKAIIYMILHCCFTEKDGINTVLIFEKLHLSISTFERLRKHISTNIFPPLLQRNLLIETSVRGVYRKTRDFAELCEHYVGKDGFTLPDPESASETPTADFSDALPVIPPLVEGSLRYDIYKSIQRSFSTTNLISSLGISNDLELEDFKNSRLAITRCLAEMKSLFLIEPVGIEGVYKKNAWFDAALDAAVVRPREP